MSRYASVVLVMPYCLPSAITHEIDIKKSRFIAHLAPVESREAALAVLQRLKADYPGASHYCWALLAGNDSAAHDDGEPSGTAGRPMLAVLQHKELVNIVAIVVRYFGGVKLGAGGLTRAYSQAVSQAIAATVLQPLLPRQQLQLRFPFELENRVRHACQSLEVSIGAVEYLDEAVLTVSCLAADEARIVSQLQETGAGRLLILRI